MCVRFNSLSKASDERNRVESRQSFACYTKTAKGKRTNCVDPFCKVQNKSLTMWHKTKLVKTIQKRFFKTT